MQFDAIIIGAGMYGLYATKVLSERGYKVLVLEYDSNPFMRASYINQARVHNGYHYPRSLSTALKSAKYFNRFVSDFPFAINNTFEKIYAISSQFSFATAENFQKFCDAAKIKCEEVVSSKYFKSQMIEKTFSCLEYSFDYAKIRDYFINEIKNTGEASFLFNARIDQILNAGNNWDIVEKSTQKIYKSPFVLKYNICIN